MNISRVELKNKWLLLIESDAVIEPHQIEETQHEAEHYLRYMFPCMANTAWKHTTLMHKDSYGFYTRYDFDFTRKVVHAEFR